MIKGPTRKAHTVPFSFSSLPLIIGSTNTLNLNVFDEKWFHGTSFPRSYSSCVTNSSCYSFMALYVNLVNCWFFYFYYLTFQFFYLILSLPINEIQVQVTQRRKSWRNHLTCDNSTPTWPIQFGFSWYQMLITAINYLTFRGISYTDFIIHRTNREHGLSFYYLNFIRVSYQA